MTRYCDENGENCPQMDRDRINKFQNAMTVCFKKAVSMGFTLLETTPHLDDATYKLWRNAVAFSPTEKLSGFSYVDIMLQPLANAFNEVLSPKVQVYFSMQGEMGATIIRNAADWLPVLKAAKGWVVKSKDPKLRANVKVGTSTNWNKICGCFSERSGGIIDPDLYLSQFTAGFPKLSKALKFNLTAIQAVYALSDFIGISYYPFKAEPLTPAALSYTANLYAKELRVYGVDLVAAVAKGKALRLHEYGFGGGKGGNVKIPERNITRLMRYTFFGIGGKYDWKQDPFRLYVKPPTASVPARDLLRKFYNQSLKWFNAGGGPKYKFNAVYLWNSGSWDVTGVSPDSTNDDGGSWRDPITQQVIKNYNDKGIMPK